LAAQQRCGAHFHSVFSNSAAYSANSWKKPRADVLRFTHTKPGECPVKGLDQRLNFSLPPNSATKPSPGFSARAFPLRRVSDFRNPMQHRVRETASNSPSNPSSLHPPTSNFRAGNLLFACDTISADRSIPNTFAPAGPLSPTSAHPFRNPNRGSVHQDFGPTGPPAPLPSRKQTHASRRTLSHSTDSLSLPWPSPVP